MGHTCLSPSAVTEASAAAERSIVVCVKTSRRLRSKASATTPPTSEQRTIGTTRTSPTSPKAAAECVRR